MFADDSLAEPWRMDGFPVTAERQKVNYLLGWAFGREPGLRQSMGQAVLTMLSGKQCVGYESKKLILPQPSSTPTQVS